MITIPVLPMIVALALLVVFVLAIANEVDGLSLGVTALVIPAFFFFMMYGVLALIGVY